MPTNFDFDLQTHSKVIIAKDRQEDRQTDGSTNKKIENAFFEFQNIRKKEFLLYDHIFDSHTLYVMGK